MNAVVKINDTELQVVEYQGLRVITLAQMDTVHERPEGTAGRNYREHKHRLVEGTDFCKVGADEFRRHLDPSHSKFASEDVILLTERGYLLLVKSFTDDLAWKVQGDLVDGYFRGKSTGALPAKPAPRIRARSPLEQMKMIAFAGDSLKGVPGVRMDVIAVVKLRAFQDVTGIDMEDFRRALPPQTLERMVHLNPSEIGARIATKLGLPKVTPQLVNKILCEQGLQRKSESGYVLTEAGMQHAEVLPFKAPNQHHGVQIDWFESVVAVVAEHMPNAAKGGSVVALPGAASMPPAQGASL